MKILFYGGSWLGPATFRALTELGHTVVFDHEACEYCKTNSQGKSTYRVIEAKLDMRREYHHLMSCPCFSAVVSAGWHAKLPPFEGYRAINLHPSPLPLFKGKQPLLAQRAAGVRHTALTIHELAEEFDSGPILVQRFIPLSEGWTLDEAGSKIRAVLKGCLQAALDGPGGVN